jgi:hypothetical protein
MQQMSGGSERHHSNRARQSLGHEIGALQWIDRHVHRVPQAAAHMFPDEQHGRLVHLTLADHHRAGNRDSIQHAAHRVHGGLVGSNLVPTAHPAARLNGSRFRDAHHF